MDIRLDDLSGLPVQALLAAHLSSMQKHSPPGSVYALDLSGLKAPNVSLWAAWDGDDLMGIGALKQLTETAGEIKSMRTASAHLRQGVGLSILNHIIAEAKQRGYVRLSLETGSGDEFEPALRLYRKRGFENGAAFGDYVASEFNQFLHLEL
ncbi:GNAT family N-acetyltransferase [Parasphingorhabdus cellanae]|uniref:GNAT family N-acetyltransferase n=1 Tax=Parasphingorhabdus cellanae TaxID=2806553 RepID=A0ABX7T714_9SPHN|nr:GNAT family N-acetyltransferase [Parasphingorhabdus cellanae]QTD56587.1 GNAT family N-acetyltransferase [Parasphingorhabdus cellanae]